MIKKINLKKLIIIILLLAIGWYCVPRAIGYIGGIFDVLQDLPQEYAKKPSEWLIKKMYSHNWRRADVAYTVLVKRKEKKAVPYIIKMLKRDMPNASMYIQGLTEIGDPRAIPVIVEIMEKHKHKGVKDDTFVTTILCLAKFRYEPIWPLISKMSESNNLSEMKLAIAAMRGFGKPEGIFLLKKMQERYEKEASIPRYKYDDYYKEKIRVYVNPTAVSDAIRYIESLQQKSSNKKLGVRSPHLTV